MLRPSHRFLLAQILALAAASPCPAASADGPVVPKPAATPRQQGAAAASERPLHPVLKIQIFGPSVELTEAEQAALIGHSRSAYEGDEEGLSVFFTEARAPDVVAYYEELLGRTFQRTDGETYRLVLGGKWPAEDELVVRDSPSRRPGGSVYPTQFMFTYRKSPSADWICAQEEAVAAFCSALEAKGRISGQIYAYASNAAGQHPSHADIRSADRSYAAAMRRLGAFRLRPRMSLCKAPPAERRCSVRKTAPARQQVDGSQAPTAPVGKDEKRSSAPPAR